MKHPVTAASLSQIQFTDGLVPVIAQDETTGAVLMLAWANREAIEKTLATGTMTYYSRSRGQLWVKGETSGNTQRLVQLAADCDQDALLAIVQQKGPACHENTGTCWTHQSRPPVATQLGVIDRVADHRRHQPQGRYTDTLLADPGLAADKVEEEAGEVAAVLRGLDNDDSLSHELADLFYHALVAAHGAGACLEDVLRELADR